MLRALEPSLDGFSAEVTKSIKFFETRYPSVTVDGVLVTGFAATVPQFSQYLAGKIGKQTQVANPWQGVQVSDNDQRQLAAVAMEFSTVIGLAKRGAE